MAHSAPDETTITASHAVPVHEETQYKSARELGIPMPFPTAKPAVASLALVLAFSGLLFIHLGHVAVAIAISLSSLALFIGTLYAWLTSPLE